MPTSPCPTALTGRQSAGQTGVLRQNEIDVPLILSSADHMRSALDDAKSSLGDVLHPARNILTKRDGTPMGNQTMADTMTEDRERLGLMAFDRNAPRYRGGMELARAGCDDEEIASNRGQTTTAMIRKYAGEALQIMRARQTSAKWQ